MLAACPDTLAGRRDRALLGVSFGAALRRSEAAALTREAVESCDEGVVLTIHRRKTDQLGQGRKVAIPWATDEDLCAVRALSRWLAASGIVCGPLLVSVDRHGRMGASLDKDSIGRIVKRCARRAGLDAENLSGHSLRSGNVTSAWLAGASETTIMRQTTHKTEEMLRRYIKTAELFRRNSALALGA